MSKGKLERFAELKTFRNVFEYPDYPPDKPFFLKGKWRSGYFKNDNLITLELACGKGEYTVALAKKYPDRNFIGIDIKGARIWKGAKMTLEEGLKNVAFLRIFIDQLHNYFDKEEIDQIWITFPDPYPKKSKKNKRLTSSKFLNLYRNILKKGGQIHLKTDSELLYQFSLETIKAEKCKVEESTEDLYNSSLTNEILTIKTYFELKHLEEGKAIKYLCFSF